MKQILLMYSQGRTFNLLGPAIDACDVDALGPSGLVVSGDQAIQVEDLLRSKTKLILPRGNNVITIRYEVSRQHGSVQAAEDYLIVHRAMLPMELGMVCEIRLNGPAIKRYYLTQPLVQSSEGTYRGLRTFHTYTLLGGQLTPHL